MTRDHLPRRRRDKRVEEVLKKEDEEAVVYTLVVKNKTGGTLVPETKGEEVGTTKS